MKGCIDSERMSDENSQEIYERCLIEGLFVTSSKG